MTLIDQRADIAARYGLCLVWVRQFMPDEGSAMRWAIWLSAAAIAIALGIFRGPLCGVSDVAHESAQFHLKLTGSSIYEFHAKHGRWPTKIGDLAQTSLPAVSPHWQYLLDEELIVVVWPQDLKSKPEDNAGRILAFYNKGLISEQGRSWVCWGDLRTEYIETDALRAYLDNPEH